MMSRKVLAITVALAVLGTGLFSGYHILNRLEVPDLSLKDQFPVGFDRQTMEFRAVGYGGKSRCIGSANIMGEWRDEGIYHSEAATAQTILDANPLMNPAYSVVGPPTPPQRIARHDAPQYSVGFCRFQYSADVWKTTAEVENHKEVPLYDANGIAFVFALTPVKLGGNGDSNAGSRFLLQGTAADPSELALDFRLFERGDYRPSGMIHRGGSVPIMTWDDNFIFIFDVPAGDSRQQVDLMMIPTREANGVTEAHAPGSLKFTHLFRLETAEAQHIVLPSEISPPDAPLGPTSRTYAEQPVYRGPDLGAAIAASRQSSTANDDGPPSATNLEVISDISFLIQNAVEPLAKPGTARRAQSLPPVDLRSVETRLEIISAARVNTAATGYAWATDGSAARFVTKIAHSHAATTRDVAQVTAAVTQIGADGVVAVHSIRHGSSPQAAVVAVSRALDAQSQIEELRDMAKSRQSSGFLQASQKYFLAAAGIEAGWELMAARLTSDPALRVEHESRAVFIATVALFSLTPQGAIMVAASAIGAWAVEKIASEELTDLLKDGATMLFVLVSAKPRAKDVHNAFAEAVPHLVDVAMMYDASVLPLQPAKRSPVPVGLAIAALLGTAIVIARWRR